MAEPSPSDDANSAAGTSAPGTQQGLATTTLELVVAESDSGTRSASACRPDAAGGFDAALSQHYRIHRGHGRQGGRRRKESGIVPQGLRRLLPAARADFGNRGPAVARPRRRSARTSPLAGSGAFSRGAAAPGGRRVSSSAWSTPNALPTNSSARWGWSISGWRLPALFWKTSRVRFIPIARWRAGNTSSRLPPSTAPSGRKQGARRADSARSVGRRMPDGHGAGSALRPLDSLEPGAVVGRGTFGRAAAAPGSGIGWRILAALDPAKGAGG